MPNTSHGIGRVAVKLPLPIQFRRMGGLVGVAALRLRLLVG
ncbi:hypothetical protein [Kribbella lupini]